MSYQKRTVARPASWRSLHGLIESQINHLVAEWSFREDGGCWRGWHQDGRRTPLKGSLRAAQEDALNDRCVCAQWPRCKHRDVDICCAQARIIRDSEPAQLEYWR